MRRLLIALVVLAAVAVVGDRIAEQVAAGQVATMVQDRENLSSAPDVEFGGFPFLTQVLSNDLREVEVTLPTVEAAAGDEERIRVDDVKATFFDVRTSDGFRGATADRLSGSAVIPYDSVSAIGPFTASYAGADANGDGFISLTPDENVLDGGAGVSIDVGVSVGDGNLQFTGAGGSARAAAVPRNLRPVLGSLLDVNHPLYGLPSSFTVESLQVDKAGISLKLSGP